MKSIKNEKIQDFLDVSSNIISIKQLQLLQKWQSLIETQLPPQYKAHQLIRVTQHYDSTLVITAKNSSIASRLQMMQHHILEFLHSQNISINQLKIVCSRQMPIQKITIPHIKRNLTSTSKSAFERIEKLLPPSSRLKFKISTWLKSS